MAQVINPTQSLKDYFNDQDWGGVEYEIRDPEPNAITLLTAGNDEMIRITAEGFWVRGVKIPQDDKEAETVYNAFKQWLAWTSLQRK